MNIHHAGDIRYYQFDTFQHADLVHGVFARQGGVSPEHYRSLNMSISTGDAPERVLENRARAFRALGRDPESIADLWQVHSAAVVIADKPHGENWASEKADAILTDNPQVSLFLRFADCVPILLFDPVHHALGVVHAGWKGTLLKAPAAAVQAMQARYGSRPSDILAGIGPSIGPCHYEVGAEVVEQTRQVFSGADELLPPVNGKQHLDLWAANARGLREVGVEQIELGRVCTACHVADFFSHRAEKGKTGRFGALLALRS